MSQSSRDSSRTRYRKRRRRHSPSPEPGAPDPGYLDHLEMDDTMELVGTRPHNSAGPSAPHVPQAGGSVQPPESDHPSPVASGVSGQESALTLRPVEPEVFYDYRAWVRDRRLQGLTRMQAEFLKIYAAMIFADKQCREAAHYGTWMLAGHRYLTAVELLPDRMKMAISTLCPQLPVVSERDYEDAPLPPDSDDIDGSDVDENDGASCDMISAELVVFQRDLHDGAGENFDNDDNESDNPSDNSSDAGTDEDDSSADDDDLESEDTLSRHGSVRGQADANDRQPSTAQAQAPSNQRQNFAEEIIRRAGSLRIPDFVQVSHIFDLRGVDDIFLVMEEICYEMEPFCEKTESQKNDLHILSQSTLLFEIKPEDHGYTRTEIQKFHKQLIGQGRTFFASGAREDKIGGILALGRRFTYREMTRELCVDAHAPHDHQDYNPNPSSLPADEYPATSSDEPTLKKLLKLFRDESNGFVFLDMHSTDGKYALALIKYRAMELFPAFWSHARRHDVRFQTRAFSQAP